VTDLREVRKSPPEELAYLAECIRALAARVEAGEVQAVAWAYISGQQHYSEWIKVRAVDRFALQGSVAQLLWNMASKA